MASKDIVEVMIISDDEDDEIPPPSKSAPAVNSTPSENHSTAQPTSLSVLSNIVPIVTCTAIPVPEVVPSVNASNSRVDSDSDCEITEISFVPKKASVLKATLESNKAVSLLLKSSPSLTVKLKKPSRENKNEGKGCSSTFNKAENVKTAEKKSDSDELKSNSKEQSNNGTVDMDTSKDVEISSSTDQQTKPISVPIEDDDDIEEIIVLSPEPNKTENAATSQKEVVEDKPLSPSSKRAVSDDANKNCPKKFKCCNIDCSNVGSDFEIADTLVCSFYTTKSNDVKQRVCTNCKNEVQKFQEEVLKMVANNEPVVNAVRLLPRKDTVVLEDSDEESTHDAEMVEPEEDDKITVDMDEFNDIVEKTCSFLNITEQEVLCQNEISKGTEKLKSVFDTFVQEYLAVEKSIDAVRKVIYDPWESIYQELPPIEINDTEFAVPVATKSTGSSRVQRVVAMKRVTQVSSVATTADQNNDLMEIEDLGHVVCPSTSGPLPKTGILIRPTPTVGSVVYAMKNNLFGEWLKARVMEVITKNGESQFRVKFMKASASVKQVTSKQIAYTEAPKVQLAVGTRIIAVFHNSEDETGRIKDSKDHYYAGVIAEQLKIINNHRYLIFFDDGFTQYVPHSKVCVVVNQSKNVWEDCHQECQDFTRTYVSQYPERPMVKLQVGQVVKTEWNTRWWLTRVQKVDCSLVLVHFDADNRTEWIYRGSTRLGPLYTEMVKKTERQKKGERSRLHRSFVSSARKVNAPYVEYTRGAQEQQNANEDDDDDDQPRSNAPRSVARKSTGGRPQETPVNPLPNDRRETVGEVVELNLKTTVRGRLFKPHQCSPQCIGQESFEEGVRVTKNPLLIPLDHGWSRDLVTYRKRYQVVFYRAPCGRRLKSMEELSLFLRLARSNLGVDLFSFDVLVRINTEFRVTEPLFIIKDISYDKENVLIPCVNTINHQEYPVYVDYSTKRTPNKNVHLNLDPDFLVCCDCTDGCQNINKCRCLQLTLQEAQVLNPNIEPDKVGYSYRRLITPGCTAVYECNSRCSCNSTCLNRVVQHPMKVQLQLFKTEKRGWGIRTLNDLPAGTFLCIYAGLVLTEQQGNEEGKIFGDEYLAELDYIEVIENSKEGYESDVTDIEDDDTDSEGTNVANNDDDDSLDAPRKDSDDEFTINRQLLEDAAGSMTLRKRDEKELENTQAPENEPAVASTSSHNAVAKKKTGEVRAPRGAPGDSAMKSVRWHLDKSEDIFVMDAKGKGNIGRYFNHSCDPNVFVQNVFVDTHDLRFPWVAFFTNQHCYAGTELCWNYNYEIDSLPGRRLDCYCETAICKGRLL